MKVKHVLNDTEICDGLLRRVFFTTDTYLTHTLYQ